MKRFILICLIFYGAVYGQMHTALLDSLISRGIHLTVACEFDSAQKIFERIVRCDPESPAGYFYLAANLQYKLLDHETEAWKPEFEDLITRTIEKGRALQKQKKGNMWTAFYIGSAYGYQGLLQARTGALLPGFLNARKGFKILKKLISENPSFYDAYLGTGNYDYWASKYLKWFFWVPDKRKQGIEATEIAVEKGKYCRWIGLNSLGYIYYDNGQYQKAVNCFKRGLNAYPGSRFYLWGLADSFFKQNAFLEALEFYGQILESLKGVSGKNGYNEAICHFKMLKCRMALEEWEAALEHCTFILEQKVDPPVQKRLRSRYRDTEKLKMSCLQHLGRIEVIHE
jgi:tetratricopeptide (TPR) repeat protein